MKSCALLFGSLMLAGCAGQPISYLPSGTTPLVNVEAALAERLHVAATREQLLVTNQSSEALSAAYKLFWYDVQGVTQAADQAWQPLQLAPLQRLSLPLTPPSAESVNYRIYLRSHR